MLPEAADGTVAFSWEGVRATVRVSGASAVSMDLTSTFPAGNARFHVFVDGGGMTNLSITPAKRQVYHLATLDPATTHDVVVWYITDPISLSWPDLPPGYVQRVNSFVIDGGQFNQAPAPSTRRLQIIGDSITAGNQIDHVTCAPDHYGTYGAKLCERFDASCQTLAISGKGIYENCCDGNVTMTELFKYVHGDGTVCRCGWVWLWWLWCGGNGGDGDDDHVDDDDDDDDDDDG